MHFSDYPSLSSLLRYKYQCFGNDPERYNPYSRGGQQWRNQPKNLGAEQKIGVANVFDFWRKALFCLEERLSKQKITLFSENVGRACLLLPPSVYAYGGQPFAHHLPIFSNQCSLPMRHTIGYLLTMLFNIVSDFPSNDVKCNRNIW